MARLKQLAEHRSDIVAQWTERVLASYPQDTAAFLRRQKDPFANPVGAAIRGGLEKVVTALLAGDDLSEAVPPIEDIVRIRAVQEFAPSEAVGFVLGLKDAVDAVLGKRARDAAMAAELRLLADRVDRLALRAFDFYARCRQQVYELRLAELRSQVVDVREAVLAKQGKWDKLAALQEKKRAAGQPVTLPVLPATAGADGPGASAQGGASAVGGEATARGAEGSGSQSALREAQDNQSVE